VIVKLEPHLLLSVIDKRVEMAILSQTIVADDGVQEVWLLLVLDVGLLKILLQLLDSIIETINLL
jgi:hypothetical protein